MQNKLLKVGITGGMGAGKSIVCDIFRILDVPVYHADERAKQLMAEDKDVIVQITKAFGQESYASDGSVNRAFLASTVFSDIDRLKKLNGIVHPAVEKDFLNWAEQFSEQNYVLKEAALLVESGSYKNLDFLVTVVAPESIRIQRVIQRDRHRTLEEIRAIISKQLAQEEKAKLSKFVIQNDDQTLLIPQILKIHKFFINYQQTG